MKNFPIHAAAVLSLLTISSYSFEQTPPPQRRPKATTTAWITAPTASRTSAENDLKVVRRRKHPRRPSSSSSPSPRDAPPLRRTPLVDSDLLRFLSNQKRARQEQLLPSVTVKGEEENDERSSSSLATISVNGDASSAARVETEFAAYFPSLVTSPVERPVEAEKQIDSVATSNSAVKDSVEDIVSSAPAIVETIVPREEGEEVEDSTENWLGQFNSNRVSRVLLSRVVEEKERAALETLINNAGDRVQSQALARTARRRVRQFLKQRDQVWSKSGLEAEPVVQTDDDIEVAAPEPRTATQQARQSNHFEQLVDLMLSYDLTIRDIAEILIHSPGIALMRPRPEAVEATVDGSESEQPAPARGGETLQETLHRVMVELLCGTLELRRYDARKVLRRTPGLLTMRGSKSACEIVSLLVQLSVSTKSLARDQGNQLPILLSRSPSAVFRLMAFLSSDAVRMPVQNIGPLLRRSGCQELLNAVAPVPSLDKNGVIVQPEEEETMMPTANNNNHDRKEDIVNGSHGVQVNSSSSLARNKCDSVIMSQQLDTTTDPTVLSALYGRSSQIRRERINHTYKKMSETAWTLRHEIGTADLGKVIAAYPSVLLLDAKTQILPTAQYLMHELGIWEDDLPRVLQLYPVLLGKPRKEMQVVVDYLLELGVDKEKLPTIFRSFPVLLTMNVETQMKPVVEFLRTTVGLSNVGRFVSRLPAILDYSVEKDLQPKWEFLKTVSTDARFEVSRFPAFFSYPLDRVIRPRYLYLFKIKRIPIPLIARSDQVLRFGDRDFAVKIARDRDEGAAYSKFATQLQQQHHQQQVPRKTPRDRSPKKL